MMCPAAKLGQPLALLLYVVKDGPNQQELGTVVINKGVLIRSGGLFWTPHQVPGIWSPNYSR